jgi:hypothetical protein
MDEVIKQAPVGMTYEQVELIFNKNDKNILKTLIELWKVQENTIKNISETQCKWDSIREICDDYDNEMKKTIDKARENSIVNEN